MTRLCCCVEAGKSKVDLKSMILLVRGKQLCIVKDGLFYIFEKMTSKKPTGSFPLQGTPSPLLSVCLSCPKPVCLSPYWVNGCCSSALSHSFEGSPILDTSVVFLSWSRSSAVSPQVTEAINPAVGCHYFPPGPRLPPQPPSITARWPVSNYTAWWQRHMCTKQLAQGCTRQRGSRDSNPRPVDRKSGSLTTRPPNHSLTVQ